MWGSIRTIQHTKIAFSIDHTKRTNTVCFSLLKPRQSKNRLSLALTMTVTVNSPRKTWNNGTQKLVIEKKKQDAVMVAFGLVSASSFTWWSVTTRRAWPFSAGRGPGTTSGWCPGARSSSIWRRVGSRPTEVSVFKSIFSKNFHQGLWLLLQIREIWEMFVLSGYQDFDEEA